MIIPNRVVINKEGEARPVKEDTPVPAIIFERDDGWTLGAPKEFREVAYQMWKDEWIGFYLWPFELLISIKDYRP